MDSPTTEQPAAEQPATEQPATLSDEELQEVAAGAGWETHNNGFETYSPYNRWWGEDDGVLF